MKNSLPLWIIGVSLIIFIFIPIQEAYAPAVITYTAQTTTTTTITITWSENVDGAGASAGDWTISTGQAVTSVTHVDGTSTSTLNLGTALAEDATPTVTYAENGHITATADVLDTPVVGGVVATDGIVDSTGNGSGCTSDCFAPTLGVDNEGNRLVTDGFTYNGNPIDVERYFTSYPLITVDVGILNTAQFKIYDNHGPDNIRHFELAFGLGTDQIISVSKAVIEWDKTFDGIETVTVKDPDNVLQDVNVKTTTGKCADDSATECLIVTVDHTFRAPLDFNIVGTNVWDYRLNSWQNYYNHGIEVSGESLNPPNEYFGIYKGKLIHLIETAKNTAIDTDGNTWTFDNTWIKDYIYKGKIEDPKSSQGYDRDHVKFSAYKQEQELVASSLFEKYYKTSVSHEQSFVEINNIFAYEYPDTIPRHIDLELLAKMSEEATKAEKYLKEMYEKMYPSKVFDE